MTEESKEIKDNKRKGMHPNSLKNLKPAVKGEPSRNPNGRPKSRDVLSDCLKQLLAGKTPTGLTNAQLGAARQIAKMIEGDSYAFVIIRDTTEGKPNQSINLASKEPWVIKIENA